MPRCSRCHMVFTTDAQLDKHKRKYCSYRPSDVTPFDFTSSSNFGEAGNREDIPARVDAVSLICLLLYTILKYFYQTIYNNWLLY